MDRKPQPDRHKDLRVVKFGGTSLASAEAIKQSAAVAIKNQAGLIVVSATAGTTNELSDLVEKLTKIPSEKAVKQVEDLRSKHRKIARELKLSSASKKELDGLFEHLSNIVLSIVEGDYSSVLKELYPNRRHVYRQRIKDFPRSLDISMQAAKSIKRYSKRISDHILSYGEFISSILINDALAKAGADTEIVDARKIIKTDDNHRYATPLIDEISYYARKNIQPKLKQGKTIITQGFIGKAPDGSTTTLGRGGSDYSAALLAEAVGADELQIWSDVAGVATADPKIVNNTKKISHLTFQEAAELATAGAKILYPRTITPSRRSNIPVLVGNTFKPDEAGTRIEKSTSKKPLITAVALKTKQSLVTVTSERMAQEFGYMARIFEIFSKHKLSINQISTSEIAVAFTLEGYISTHEKMLQELKELGEVTIENGMSLVSLIGNDINNTPGLAGKIFSCLETKDSKIAIRMICQGASKHNFCFVVEGKYGEESTRKLHKHFIEEG
ncbi:MAG TPA: aspartate kinase [Candidatus Saccharimonadales bacterium]|nr:aspartate kinase [Candidatus Saccharimonadales bacterium]